MKLAYGRLLSGIVGGILGGCATVVEDPVEQAAIEMPPRWSTVDEERANEGVAATTDWVRAIGGAPLEDLVEEALRHNPNLAAAGARVRQAAAQARLAEAGRWPEVMANASASRSKSVTPNPFESAPGGPGDAPLPDLLETQITRYGLSADLSWEADLWGRLGDSARAAGASYAAAEADWEGARLALAGEVARQWLAYVEGAKQLALAERVEVSFRTQERVLDRRFEAGLTSTLELRLARTSSRSAAAEVAARKQQVDALARALEVLLGRYPDRSLAAATEWPAFPAAPETGIPAEVVQRRPDLRAIEARHAAAAYEYGATTKLRYPRLTLSASAGTASTEMEDLLDSDFGVWSLVGGLTAPLFTAGRIDARVAAARAGEVAALEDFAAALLTAFREVETSLAAERFLADREARLEELADETAQAEAQAWEQYERGLGGIATVLEAQRRAVESDRQLLAAQVERRQNRVNLHLALGGGFPASMSSLSHPPPDQP